MESIVIGLATYNVRRVSFFPSLCPRYTQTKFAGAVALPRVRFPIAMPIFRGENSRTLIGLVLIIVFGGYQLVASLPTSHRASSYLLLKLERKGVLTTVSPRIDVFSFAQTSVAIMALAALVFL